MWVRQWGWDDIPYMKWKIKLMFETTNQALFLSSQLSFDHPCCAGGWQVLVASTQPIPPHKKRSAVSGERIFPVASDVSHFWPIGPLGYHGKFGCTTVFSGISGSAATEPDCSHPNKLAEKFSQGIDEIQARKVDNTECVGKQGNRSDSWWYLLSMGIPGS